jgi:hypothetical protein
MTRTRTVASIAELNCEAVYGAGKRVDDRQIAY